MAELSIDTDKENQLAHQISTFREMYIAKVDELTKTLCVFCVCMYMCQQTYFLSQISTYGLDDREEVHEIEFLGLYAFVARERERLRMATDPRGKSIFTRNDLEMAYAFRQQMSGPPRGGGRRGDQGAGQPNWQGSSFPQQQRVSYFIPQSRTDASLNHRYSSISPSPTKMAAQNVRMSTSPQDMRDFPESVQLFTGRYGNQQVNPAEPHPQQRRQSVMSGEYVPLGDRLAARRAGERVEHAFISQHNTQSPCVTYNITR